MIRQTNSLSDDKQLSELKPEQKLMNIYFGDMKLNQDIRFIGGYIRGHVFDKIDVLATPTQLFELTFHQGIF